MPACAGSRSTSPARSRTTPPRASTTTPRTCSPRARRCRTAPSAPSTSPPRTSRGPPGRTTGSARTSAPSAASTRASVCPTSTTCGAACRRSRPSSSTRAAGSWYGGNVTVFANTFKGEPFSQILGNGVIVNETLASKSVGVEFEGAVRPIRNLELDVSGDYQHSYYTDQANKNNRTQRQPAFQIRFTPNYTVPFEWGSTKAFVTLTYVGQRFADVQNQQILPQYTTLDIGLEANIGQRWQVLLTGTNVTNTLAITEGNSRVLGAGVGAGGVFEGRPLFGAEYQLSVAVKL